MSQPTERPYVIRELANRVVVKAPITNGRILVADANYQATDSILIHDADGQILFTAPGLTTGYTDEFTTDTFCAVKVYDIAFPEKGGADIWGISDDADTPGVRVTAVAVTNPTDAVPVMEYRVGVANGSGGMDDIAAGEMAYQWKNNDTILVSITGNGGVRVSGLATANTGVLYAAATTGLIGATNIAAGTIPMGSATAGLAASILTQQTTASITNTGNFILNGTGAGQNIQRRGTTPWGPLDIIFWNGPSGNSPGVRILTGDGVHDDIAYAIERFRINSDAAVVDAVFSACNLLVNGTLKSTGAFGCNNVTPQTPVAYVANPTDLPTCISAMTAVLTMVKANGQMATS